MKTHRSRIIVACLLLSLVFAGWYNPKHVSADTTLNVCGSVESYIAPTIITPGVLIINTPLPIVVPVLFGATLQGEGLLTAGANVCVSLNLNVLGQATTGLVTLNVTTTLMVCGEITAFQAATAGTAGSITIGGVTIPIAPGSVIAGDQVQIGSEFCLSATLNALGQIVAPTTLTLQATT